MRGPDLDLHPSWRPGSSRSARALGTPREPNAEGSYGDRASTPPPFLGGLDLQALRGPWALLESPAQWGHTQMGPRPLASFPPSLRSTLDLNALDLTWLDPTAWDPHGFTEVPHRSAQKSTLP